MAALTHVVRTATRDDCTEIMKLIKEHAEETEENDEVLITPETLAQDGFGEARQFYVLVAEISSDNPGCSEVGKLVGYLLYSFGYSTWIGRILLLQESYISPPFRELGISSSLWQSFVKIVVQERCRRLDSYLLRQDAGVKALSKACGATNISQDERWLVYRITKNDVEAVMAPVQ